jgi:type IV pilus assembly protein PilN
MGRRDLIRINLLPVRYFRRKENIRRQVSIYVLTTVFLIGVLAYVYSGKAKEVRAIEADLDDLSAVVANLDKRVREMKKIEEEYEKLQQRIENIEALEKERRGPVRMMDALTRLIPPDQAWLTELKQSGSSLDLTGYAIDDPTVANVMSNLMESDLFGNVRLMKSEEHIGFKWFHLTCSLSYVAPKEKPEDEADSG